MSGTNRKITRMATNTKEGENNSNLYNLNNSMLAEIEAQGNTGAGGTTNVGIESIAGTTLSRSNTTDRFAKPAEEKYNPELNKVFITNNNNNNNNSNENNAYPEPRVAGQKRKAPNSGFNKINSEPPAKKSARHKVGGKRKTRKAKKSRKH